MSNVIYHPNFVSDDEENLVGELDIAIDKLDATILFLLRSEHVFSPDNYSEVCTTCGDAVVEIEEMRLNGSFTRERLLNLSHRLENVLSLMQQELTALQRP